MRLDKALALTGCSRTQAKAMIAAGRVQAGGAVARDPGLNVEIADVMLDGAPAAQFLSRVRQLLENPALLL